MKKNSTYKRKKSYIRSYLAGLLLLVLVLTGCSNSLGGNSSVSQVGTGQASKQSQISVSRETVETDASASGTLKVHYIDVGQGNSVLIQSKGKFMLMDGGDSKYSSKTVSYLKKQGVKKLDYVIATHYDADHLNGVVGALYAFKIGKVIAPNYTTTTKIYQSFRSALASKNKKITAPKVGKTYKLGSAKFTIVAPNDTHYSDANDYSVAIKLVNGKNRFMLTGDAEIESEYEMLENKINLGCDVYMTGHHGSRNSSSQAFLKAMKPKYVVISVGKENKYGHPAQETMARLKALKCKVYRTDEMGTVIATSNGSKITFNHKPSKTWSYRKYGSSKAYGSGSSSGSSASKNTVANTSTTAKASKYIGNVNSKVFHLPSCRSLPFKKNRVYFKTRKAAVKAGYRACGLCRP